MKTLGRTLFAGACFFAALSVVLVPQSALPDWQHLATEEGIEVSQREAPDRALPVFRGTGVVEAGIYEILAVIADNARHVEWMHNCIEARVLRRESETVTYAYNRTDAPWPVKDRDVIVRSERKIIVPGQEARVTFKSVPGDDLMDPKRGTVRMRNLDGHYKLKVLAPNRTHVEYQVDADPGGRIPAMLVKRTSKDLPLQTLKNLRKQVAETRGDYEEFLDRWDPSRQ